MRNITAVVWVLVLPWVFSGCGSDPVLPESEAVKASRAQPKAECTSLGIMKGVTRSAKGTAAEALEDLKQEVADKGGNYVRVEEYSGHQTAVTGEAFKCPN